MDILSLIGHYEKGHISPQEFSFLVLEGLTNGEDLEKLPPELYNLLRARVESLPGDNDDDGWASLHRWTTWRINTWKEELRIARQEDLRRGVRIVRSKNAEV